MNIHPCNSPLKVASSKLFILLMLLSCMMDVQQSAANTTPKISTAPITDDRKSVIIFPDHFEEAARAFSFLHREYGGVETLLLPLSEITHSPVSEKDITIPFDGWEHKKPKRVSIRNYDYHLAKKIIAYLQTLEKSEKILSVLLLGDGALIPPSYYFFVPYLKEQNIEDKPYNQWIASDLLYASPDFDLSHEWAVGRISVDTPAQALQVTQKYSQWWRESRQNTQHPFVYFGGNIREDIVYSGELLYLLFQQEGLVGAKDRHYFESDDRFTIEHLKNSFINDPARIHYIFTHGSGDGFEIDGSYLYSHQIASMPHKTGLPLVVSSSCLDGGFDYDLIDAPHDRDGLSIGEAILRSQGAGIGYLGSSRISLGQFHYFMKDGEVDPWSIYYRYMPGLLMDFFNAYHDGHRRIGDAYVEAHKRYRERFGVMDPQDFATFVEINLLADPVMLLPAPGLQKNSGTIEHLVIQSEHTIKKRMPLVPLNKQIKYALHEESPHDTVNVSIVDVRKGKKIGHARMTRGKDLVFSVDYASSFLMRLEFDDGTMSWQFFQSSSSPER